MSATIRAYPLLTSCVAGQPISICVASSTPLTPNASYWLRVVNAYQLKHLPTDGSNPEKTRVQITVPVLPSLRSHADENGYGWPAVSVATDPSWPSGLYYTAIVELVNGVEDEVPSSRAFFVVRPAAGRAGRIVILWPFANAHAYSGQLWGQRTCLYDSNHAARLRRVTTQKPLVDANGNEIRDGLGYGIGYTSPAYRLYEWMQQRGIAADACTSWDLQSDASSLSAYKLLILAGHDEYWSRAMRDRVEAFVASGGNVVNFSGNTAWWQVRYATDGTQVTCYKSVLEDPLLGSDDGSITANPSSAPTSHPENRMIGVGFRYGFQAGSGPLSIYNLGPTFKDEKGVEGPIFMDPYGSSLSVGASFGSTLSGEGDGVELYWPDPKHPVPTGRDGTPDTFVVLACNSGLSGGGPIGRAVLGYYTNVGTVLSCPVTNWIDTLGTDPTVATITQRAISWLLTCVNQPRMMASKSVVPPSAWTAVSLPGQPLQALTACMQGSVLVAADATTLESGHADMIAESMWQPVTLNFPLSSDFKLSTIGCNLYGSKLLVANKNLLWSADIRGSVVSGWSAPASVGGGEVITGVTDVGMKSTYILVAVDSQGRQELRGHFNDDPWFTIGDATALSAVTACDGLIVAATKNGRLVARLAGPRSENEFVVADETWIDIGAAPNATFALGQYFGRLYALSGAPGNAMLSWRSLRPDSDRLPVDHGRLLFYNATTGWCAVGRFLGHGDYENTNGFTAGAGFTHVTRINNGMVLFFNSSQGQALVGRILNDGTFQEVGRPSGFGPWSIVVSDGAHVLFYRTGSSEGYAGYFDPVSGQYHNTFYSAGFGTAWTHIVSTWGIAAPVDPYGPGKYLVFYADDGSLAFGTIDANGQFVTMGYGKAMSGADRVAPAGQLGVFFYSSAMRVGEFGEITLSDTPQYVSRTTNANLPSDGFPTNAVLGAGRNGLLFFYAPSSTAAVASGFSRGGHYQILNEWGADAGYITGWTHIIGC